MLDIDLLRCTQAAERAAVDAVRYLHRRPATVTHKGAIDLVTEVDLASEAAIRRTFAEETPDIPVQGEEGGGVATGLRWVVDPLDGTTNFVHDYPSYCVSIALVDGDEPLVGCIADPVRGRLYLGAKGHGARVQWTEAPERGRGAGRRVERDLRVSDVRTLEGAMGVTGFPYDRRENAAFYLSFVERALKSSQAIRRSGSAAMDLATLSSGASDYFWEFGLKAWDTSGGVLLITEAGGTVSRLDGSPHRPGDPEIVASNGWLHAEVLSMLAALPARPVNPYPERKDL